MRSLARAYEGGKGPVSEFLKLWHPANRQDKLSDFFWTLDRR